MSKVHISRLDVERSDLEAQLSIERSLNTEYQHKLVALAEELRETTRMAEGRDRLAGERFFDIGILTEQVAIAEQNATEWQDRAERAEAALLAVRDRFRSDPDMSGRDKWHQVGPVSVQKIVEIINAALSHIGEQK